MVVDVPKQIPPRNGNHVDREPVLRAAERLAADSDGNLVVVLKGMPGIGKTAVAGELMHRVVQHYPHGQLFCVLSDGAGEVGVSDVLSNILVALGDRREELPDRFDARHARYLSLTAGQRLLVVLDGAITAAQVRALQPADGGSLVVVTGRNSATDLSAGGVMVFELDRLSDNDSRELLARIVGTERLAAEPEATEAILTLSDNLPFAICVLGSMLAQHPSRPIATLAGVLRDERRRSVALALPEVFDAAYRSVSSDAQRCYLALGMLGHSGWLHVGALAHVLDLTEDEITWAAMELVDLHLMTERDGGFHAASMVRVHARTVADSGRPEYEQRMVDYYDRGLTAADVLLAPARPWRALLFPATMFPALGYSEFTDVEGARAWLRREQTNIAALAVRAVDVGDDDLVVRWCVLLWSFYEKDKYLDSMRAMHVQGIAAARRIRHPGAESLLHIQLGFHYYWLRELPDAVTAFETGVRAARAMTAGGAAMQLEASALEGLGLAELARGRLGEGRTALRRNYELAADIGDPRRIGLAALHLAKAEEADRALHLTEKADAILATLPSDETENRAKVSAVRGRALADASRYTDAEPLLTRALEVMRARGRRFDEAETLVALGDCALGTGDRRGAIELFRAGHDIYTALRFVEPMAAAADRIATAESI